MGFEKPFHISTYGLVRLCAGVEIVKKAPLWCVCVCVCLSAANMMSSVLDIFFMTGCAALFSRIKFNVN